ncbi:MAG: Cof-type HAD-IIB family hydrolase [Chitinophagaceae bacterium]
MYKVVFIDLDGTLLKADHSVSEETRMVIQKLRDQGILIVLVSARPYHAIVSIHNWLGIDAFPIASLNGSYIRDTDKVLFSATIAADSVTGVQQIAGEFNATLLYYSGLRWFSETSNPYTAKEQLITSVQLETFAYPELTSMWSKDNLGINKIMGIGTEADIQGLQARIRAEFKGINAYTSKPTYLEIMPEHASKASAVKHILELYNIPREQSIALGDNFNDKEMLIYAGLGIAMGNAPDEIKGVADEVTDTNQNDGVRKALERLFKL